MSTSVDAIHLPDTQIMSTGVPYWLVNARVPIELLDTVVQATAMPRASNLANVSLRIANGHITAIECAGPVDEAPIYDLAGGLVFSGWVDAHTHLDKGHTGPRINALDCSLVEAINASESDRLLWTQDDLITRMEFSLRTAQVHGTRAMRTHIDWITPEVPLAWKVALDLQRTWRQRMTVQLAALTPIGMFSDHATGEKIARSVREADGILGAYVYPTKGQHELIARVFELARHFDLHLDFHVDEHTVPNTDGMRSIAALAEKYQNGARVVCGHCCALSAVAETETAEILDRFVSSGVTLICMPFTNLHLQDRRDSGSPRLRGMLPIVEANRCGIPVAIASDNHRDPYFPFGDLDPLQVLTVASYAAHLPDPVGRWADTITTIPARALGLDWDGVLRPGCPADLVLLKARDSFEACSRPQSDRIVLKAGRLQGARLPDFRELDVLYAQSGCP
jgi:cytosine/creatinine deaminase